MNIYKYKKQAFNNAICGIEVDETEIFIYDILLSIFHIELKKNTVCVDYDVCLFYS